MMRRRILIALIVGMFILLVHSVGRANQQAEAEAAEATEVWLALVDGGKYSESWNATAELFKKAVSKDQRRCICGHL